MPNVRAFRGGPFGGDQVPQEAPHLMSGIGALINETSEKPLVPSPWEGSVERPG